MSPSFSKSFWRPWIERWTLWDCLMYELLYLTFTEHFCQVISRDQPSVIGTGALSVDPVAFLCFIPKDKTFLLVTYAFRSTCWLTKKEKLLNRQVRFEIWCEKMWMLFDIKGSLILKSISVTFKHPLFPSNYDYCKE